MLPFSMPMKAGGSYSGIAVTEIILEVTHNAKSLDRSGCRRLNRVAGDAQMSSSKIMPFSRTTCITKPSCRMSGETEIDIYGLSESLLFVPRPRQ